MVAVAVAVVAAAVTALSGSNTKLESVPRDSGGGRLARPSATYCKLPHANRVLGQSVTLFM